MSYRNSKIHMRIVFYVTDNKFGRFASEFVRGLQWIEFPCQKSRSEPLSS